MSNSRLHKLGRLSAFDICYLFVVALLVVAIRLSLFLLPFQTIVRCITGFEPGLGENDPRRLARSVWAVRVVSAHAVPRATCLTQALAVLLLVRRQGEAGAKLRLGVARDEGGRFAAHAWVEHDGRILIGAQGSGRYTRLPAFAGSEA